MILEDLHSHLLLLQVVQVVDDEVHVILAQNDLADGSKLLSF